MLLNNHSLVCSCASQYFVVMLKLKEETKNVSYFFPHSTLQCLGFLNAKTCSVQTTPLTVADVLQRYKDCELLAKDIVFEEAGMTNASVTKNMESC